MIVRIILFAVAFHMAFSAVRVTASLDTLAHGYGATTVGLMVSLLALLPTFAAMPFGRLIDRVGPRKPLLAAGALLALGTALPAVFPTASYGLVPLAFGCAFTGLGMSAAMMVAQQLIGFVSNASNRTANFAWLSMGQAASGLATPVISGMLIDAVSHRAAFGFSLAAAAAGLVIALLSVGRFPASWGRPPRLKGSAGREGAFSLFGDTRVRHVLIVSAVVSMAWDLEIFMFPVYGHAVGLTATEIGWMIGSFFAATFAVRFLIPFLSKRVSEWTFLFGVLAIGAASYAVFPLFTTLGPLLVCAFTLGLGLGASQPNVMSLLQTESPPGRVGEALGIRTMLTNLCHTVLPTALGALASAVGAAAIFFAMAALMAGTAGFTKLRCGKNPEREGK